MVIGRQICIESIFDHCVSFFIGARPFQDQEEMSCTGVNIRVTILGVSSGRVVTLNEFHEGDSEFDL